MPLSLNILNMLLLCAGLLTAGFVGFIIFLYCRRYRQNRWIYLKNINGPPPNILFGNLFDFMGSTADFLDTLQNYFKTYGKTVLVRDGPLSKVVLTIDSKLVEFIMSSTKLIDKASNYEFFYNWLGTGLLTSTGAKWKHRRRLLTPTFHFSILENFVDVFENVGNVFVEKLHNEVGKDSVNIHPLVALCTLDIICETAMGVSINAQGDKNSKYVSSVKKMCEILTDRNFSPLDGQLYPFTWNYYKEKMAVKVLHNHTVGVINKKLNERKTETLKKNGLGKERLAFLDLLIQSSHESKNFLSIEDIREEVDTFMFEGHDTTASAISFALYCLASNAEVQEKAVEEQKSLFDNLKSARPSVADFNKMNYMELIIKETLRLYPSVPFFGRNVPEDFEFDGVFYPKGIKLVVIPYFIHRQSEYFPDPDKFIPERFLNTETNNPYVYIPFSAGPRNCIGRRFAMLEMKSTISKVLRNFELLPSEPRTELRLAPEIILLSKTGINIRLKQRLC